MKKILLSATALVALSATAFAADLPSRVAAPSLSAPPVFTWTGFYVGANAGYGFGRGKSTDVVVAGTRYPSHEGSFNSDGAIGGGQVGYNYQIGNVVIGAEADLQSTGVKGSYVELGSTDTGRIEYLGTVRARAGYAFGNVLLFATGGFAYGSTKVTVTNIINSSSPVATDRVMSTGYVLGGGVEYALTNNWTVKGEYLYVNLGKKGLSFYDTVNTVLTTANASSTTNVVRLGVNYKF